MVSNKKVFNYTILFVVIYGILAILVLLWIWWPKNSNNKFSTDFKYVDVDEEKKASDMYALKIKPLLAKKDLPLLYSKLNFAYKKQYNLNENTYQSFLEGKNYISQNIDIIESSINIQDDDVYVYRYKYKSNGYICYVNVIETKPYEYTLSFEQDTIPIVNNSSNNSSENSSSNTSNVTISNIDDVKYELSKERITENSITYILEITNNSDKTIEYKLDNITNVLAILSDGRIANLGGAVVTSDDYVLTPNSYLKKELFFPISSVDQNKIESIKIKNVRIGDEKKTINIDV